MTDIVHLKQYVLLASFGIALLLGMGMQRTQFCSMGAISDVFVMQSWNRARQWCVALAIAMISTNLLYFFSAIDIHQTIYTGHKLLWLSHIVGGTLFGFGMAIASGCGAKNLVRFGGGNLKSLLVLLVMGLFAQMTLRGVFGVLRVNTVDQVFIELSTHQDLGSMLAGWIHLPATSLAVVLSLVMGLLLLFFAFRVQGFRQHGQWWVSVLVGFAVIGLWWVSGNLAYVPEDPNTLEPVFLASNSGKMESVSLVAPLAYWLDYLTLFSDTSKTISFAMVIAFGIVLGSFLSAVQARQWRLQGFSSTQDMVNHLLGGACMGIGGITALGCTFGQGLSGMSTLALSSLITVFSLIAGVYCGLQYLEKAFD